MGVRWCALTERRVGTPASPQASTRRSPLGLIKGKGGKNGITQRGLIGEARTRGRSALRVPCAHQWRDDGQAGPSQERDVQRRARSNLSPTAFSPKYSHHHGSQNGTHIHALPHHPPRRHTTCELKVVRGCSILARVAARRISHPRRRSRQQVDRDRDRHTLRYRYVRQF